MRVRTRFAPAPTGALHLGHVLNALFVWRLARERDGEVLLRIDDHDRQRSRPEHERALLDDLDWLGLVPDIHPTSAFRAGRCDGRQSDRQPHYEQAAATLMAAGLVYGCGCSRQDLEGSVPGMPGERPYVGTCRERGLEPGPGLTWRVRLDAGAEHFDDLLCGRHVQDPAADCGDVAIRDRLGNWTYQFVASVDDHLQGITLVVRGLDLLASTGRQIRLARLLGRAAPPRFAHHPLVMKSATAKLSKSDGDTGVRDLRGAGWTPERVLREAAARAGIDPWMPDER